MNRRVALVVTTLLTLAACKGADVLSGPTRPEAFLGRWQARFVGVTFNPSRAGDTTSLNAVTISFELTGYDAATNRYQVANVSGAGNQYFSRKDGCVGDFRTCAGFVFASPATFSAAPSYGTDATDTGILALPVRVGDGSPSRPALDFIRGVRIPAPRVAGYDSTASGLLDISRRPWSRRSSQ